jgi:hypothetical protein
MRVDDWGESGVSRQPSTEYGRAYNTDQLDAAGAQALDGLPGRRAALQRLVRRDRRR